MIARYVLFLLFAFSGYANASSFCPLLTAPVVTEAEGQYLVWDPSRSPVRARMIFDQSVTPTEKLIVGQAQLSMGEKLPLHYHEQVEVYRITAGTGRMILGDQMIDVIPGMYIFIPSNVLHQIEGTSESEDLEFEFTFAADGLADVEYLWAILLGNGEIVIEE